MGAIELYAIVGVPIMRSASPTIHNAAFRATRRPARYLRLCAGTAREALDAARAMGLHGLNVTAPFKEEFARLVDRLDGDAAGLGAVNTVVFRKGRATGSCTDAYGVATALRTNGVALEGRRALVLGAGGAARGAVQALVREGARVVVANRSVARGRALARKFRCDWSSLEEHDLSLVLPEVDVIVSAVSTGDRVLPRGFLRPGVVVMDANYAAPTTLVREAAMAGCRLVDGREWLLHQGAKAFEAFTGGRAPLEAMRRALTRGAPPARRLRSLALVGFMGTGKSTVAEHVARRTGMRLIDLDRRVEDRAQSSIAQIMAAGGERAFRSMEGEELERVRGARGCVVACGGGAMVRRRNVEAVRENCFVAWLWARPETAVRRILAPRTRPLLAFGLGSARKLFERRLAGYAGACDIAVDTESRSADEVADLVVRAFREVEP